MSRVIRLRGLRYFTGFVLDRIVALAGRMAPRGTAAA